jgi:RNA polymerase sigma-70 factor (ECF subfamily)
MDDQDWLADRFEAHRRRLRSVAYRMLGSLTEADDAVQEAWLRLSRADAEAVEQLGAWLTTVTARVCLDMLRSRTSRHEEPLEVHLPELIVSPQAGADPEQEALLADSVGIALLVVLETLAPAERLAFVLHDMFAVPFDEIAPIVGRSPAAARQLASRARRRVRQADGRALESDPDVAHQRAVVNAFIAAARDGNFDALLSALDPDVVLRADYGPGRPSTETRGARAVAEVAQGFTRLARFAHPVLVNGAAGILVAPQGRPFALLAYTVTDGRITEIDVLADRGRLDELDLSGVIGPT